MAVEDDVKVLKKQHERGGYCDNMHQAIADELAEQRKERMAQHSRINERINSIVVRLAWYSGAIAAVSALAPYIWHKMDPTREMNQPARSSIVAGETRLGEVMKR